MRTCEEYRLLFDDYLDRELTRMERMELEAHIEQCEECRNLFNEYEKLYSEDMYVMPESVCEKVMERVKASVADDMFTGEENKEEVEFAVRKKLRKRDGIKAWGLIAAVLVMAIGYYFLEDWVLGKKTTEEAAPESVQGEKYGEYNGSVAEDASGTKGSDVMLSLRNSLANADSLTVKFGTSKVVLYEKFEIEYLADYITSCLCTPIEGRVDYKSVGSIKTEPDNRMNINITDEHKIVFTLNSQIYEIETDRDGLLYAFEGVGLLS